jgi:hypothetical protein
VVRLTRRECAQPEMQEVTHPISASALRAIAHGAAELYLGGGNEAARQAAQLMKAARLERPSDPSRSLDVLRYLPSVALPGVSEEFGRLVRTLGPKLPWTDRGFELPEGIRGRNAYAELMGPSGPMISDDCRFGFYLQAPNCLYPVHCHAAEEFYYLLSGSAEWCLDGAQTFVPPVPGLIHHRPWQLHEMRTGPSPLLAMWIWTGDISYSTYAIRECS